MCGPKQFILVWCQLFWFIMIYGPVCSSIVSYGQLQLSLIQFSLSWSGLVLHSPFQYGLVQYIIWYCFVNTSLVKFSSIQSNTANITRLGLQCQTPPSYLSWTISFGQFQWKESKSIQDLLLKERVHSQMKIFYKIK